MVLVIITKNEAYWMVIVIITKNRAYWMVMVIITKNGEYLMVMEHNIFKTFIAYTLSVPCPRRGP